MGKDHDRERALRRLTGEEIMEETRKQAVRAWGKLLPFGAQVVASAAAYSVGITATQLVGFVLKISCATPVLGPTMGLVGVGLANVLAGQASKHTRKMVVAKSHPLQPGFWEAPQPEDLLLDAVMGVTLFKTLGGRFSSVMPSDLTKPGALAFESIPARADRSEAYAQPSVKRELARMFKRDGCHHCGSRKPPVVGDHMPPTKLLHESKEQMGKWAGQLPLIGKVAEVLSGGRGRRGPLQRFYPQCQRCSIKQASAVRTGRRVLVLHLHWPRRGRGEHLAAVFVGLRYNAPDLSMSAGGGGDVRRRSGKWASLTMAAADAALPAVGFRDGSGLALQQLPCPLAPELSSGSLSRGWTSNTTSSSSPYLQVTPLLDGHISPAGTTAWQQQQQAQLYGGGAVGSPAGSSPQQHGSYLTSPRTGAYTSGLVSYTAASSNSHHLTQGPAAVGGLKAGGGGSNHHGSGSGGKGGAQQGGMALMQHVQQRQRGVSGPGGDEAARQPDQNHTHAHGHGGTGSEGHQAAAAAAAGGGGGAGGAGGGLMVSLEGWAVSAASTAAAAAGPARQGGSTAADVAMAPEHAKARAEAAFERHFAPGLTY